MLCPPYAPHLAARPAPAQATLAYHTADYQSTECLGDHAGVVLQNLGVAWGEFFEMAQTCLADFRDMGGEMPEFYHRVEAGQGFRAALCFLI